MKRKRGAPKGNVNALRHGFYSKALTKAEALDLTGASQLENVDQELALIRTKLISLLARAPDNMDLQISAVRTIARLVQLNHALGAKEKRNLVLAVGEVFKTVGAAVGLVEGAKDVLGHDS